MRALWALAYLWLCGCAAQHKPVRRFETEVEVPRWCMEYVELTDHAECHGADVEHLSCTGLMLKKKVRCETVRIAPVPPKPLVFSYRNKNYSHRRAP